MTGLGPFLYIIIGLAALGALAIVSGIVAAAMWLF